MITTQTQFGNTTEQNTGVLFKSSAQAQERSNALKVEEPNSHAFFKKRWDSQIANYMPLSDMLDDIVLDSVKLDAAENNASNIDEWFNAYLCSDEFARLASNAKKEVIESKNAVKWLIQRANEFTEYNNLGVYSESEI